MNSESGLRASGRGRVVAGGLLACLLLAGGLRILAPSLLTRYLESRLGRSFGTAVSIGHCEFDLLSRSITLRDVTIASPLPGAGRPLLRVAQADAAEVDVMRLMRDRTLRLERASLEGVDLATEGRSSGDSSVAVAQDRIRGVPARRYQRAGVSRSI